ncbi:MAG: NADH-quinone oxidoreductase subunit C [Gammaproteobacteria bacterium]|nr:NADH-quinone oxidoreductase subunit C [Gammaproteobacteria bacterium]
MASGNWWTESLEQAGAPGVRTLTVSRDDWTRAARELHAERARLLALWASHGTRATVRAVFLIDCGALLLSLPLDAGDPSYPGLEAYFPCASRLQRAIADLSGLRCTDPDARAWLRHNAWPPEFHPLAPNAQLTPHEGGVDVYPFVRVEGEGVHEIPVGPVHAGIIEPGHFRFSVVGEKVLRLEERLGYVHKGIERRFTELHVLDAHRLAARVSGDSAVAFSWAYCQALEGMAGISIPPRAAWLRGVCLELERIANHLGDLGALGNDAGFAFGLAQFSRLKEQLLRACDAALGERYLMDTIVPGGTRADLGSGASQELRATVRTIAQEAATLRTVYDEHEGVRDRFTGAGAIAPELAARLGVVGLVGRASGQAFDLRCDHASSPYTEVTVEKIGRRGGDVAARVAVRFDELQESALLIGRLLEELPPGPRRVSVPVPRAGALGIGLIEGWRGPVLIALETGADGVIARCHPHDPSWQNWPALEHAIIGNIVPDFPLINKSFNLSYSGHDL